MTFHETLTFINFVSDFIWEWHDLFMYFIYAIEESDASQEHLCYVIWYLKRKTAF